MNLGIYVFDEMEALDFAGPYEVFSTASRVHGRLQRSGEPPFQVLTIGAQRGLVKARAGLQVLAEFAVQDHPALDVLIVPGGVVTAELAKTAVLEWIARQHQQVGITASICTGAFLLGAAGLLQGKQITTHWEDIEDLRQACPGSQVVEGVRWVEQGNLLTSAGISAGIDMSLHLCARLTDRALAQATARQMDYFWRESPV